MNTLCLAPNPNTKEDRYINNRIINDTPPIYDIIIKPIPQKERIVFNNVITDITNGMALMSNNTYLYNFLLIE